MASRMLVLDHGFVELVESWGSDERIIEAARESTDKGFLGWGPRHADDCRYTHWLFQWMEGNASQKEAPCTCAPEAGDEKLLAFLDKNRHTSPFEFAGAVIRVQAPIFVFREWHRHRTQAYSEISARYTPLPDFNYLPTVERTLLNSKTNKQAGTVKDADKLTADVAADLLTEEADLLVTIEDLYQRKLKAGFPKELARTHLNVSRYSRMRATANLHNWLHFLTLREAPGAQWEIRQYAHAVSVIIKELFPRTHALYVERTAR